MQQEFRTGFRGVAGVGAFFIGNGAVLASLLPWYPLMIERLELGAWQFGLIVASFAVGSISSTALPAPLIARFRAVPVAVVGTVVIAAAVALAGWSGSGLMLAVCIFLIGFFDAIVDIAQNLVGIAVQDGVGRPILSSMHALWSLGGVLSGVASTAAATAGLDMRIYLAVVGVICVALVAQGGLLVGDAEIAPKPNAVPSGKHSSRWRGVLVAALPLAAIAICGTMIEDVANNWSAIAAVQLSSVPAASAGIAFSVIIGSQCVGRFSGDLLIHRYGRTRTARLGGILIALGGVVIISATAPIQLLAGLAAAGFGSATLVPSAFVAAANIPGVSQSVGLTLVNWLMRVGFLVTSPIIGVVTTAANLRWGLSLLLAIGAVIIALAGRLAAVDKPAAPSTDGD